ncbi:MAG: type VI secretion system ATPase TssH, partial [Actinobacteria bacterium]|nr:type VI secretion system ATPase TssH [Actinomycetota bacterium]NIS37354.1 type VI secretion system ATPase TssH [Actinomycetota bacterium]NIT99231.1 type VI secretion system ATPase TssH [Actinomycetota bacterium]NIU22832.1 type VI secretion system ATPase TssH [Actinomycetota bacterium]NIU71786.1 type VI secretion system ATPase TssH [Actinomycetota bacterium]
MALDPNRWTLKTTEAFSAAGDAARAAAHPEVMPEHLLVALLGQQEGIVLPMLHKVGVDVPATRNIAEAALAKLPNAYGSDPQLSSRLRTVLTDADAIRDELTDEYLSTEHLLIALAGHVGADKEALLGALREVRGSHRVTSQTPENEYQALERFGRDLTDAAARGKLDPVIGRDDEIRRVIQVLSRRTKNNPVLIGEPGVGKTAIVEGLATRIVEG